MDGIVIIISIVIIIITANIMKNIYLKINNCLKNQLCNEDVLPKINSYGENISMCTVPFFIIMSTFVFDSMIKLKYNDPQSLQYKILSTGIVVVVLMIVLSSLYKLFYRKIFNKEYNISLVLINYLIGSIVILLFSLFYIGDLFLSLSWGVIIAGRFIWFDGTSFGDVYSDTKKNITSKELRIILISNVGIILIFLGIFKIYEIYQWNNILFIFGAILFGISFSSISIIRDEKRKNKKSY